MLFARPSVSLQKSYVSVCAYICAVNEEKERDPCRSTYRLAAAGRLLWLCLVSARMDEAGRGDKSRD